MTVLAEKNLFKEKENFDSVDGGGEIVSKGKTRIGIEAKKRETGYVIINFFDNYKKN